MLAVPNSLVLRRRYFDFALGGASLFVSAGGSAFSYTPKKQTHRIPSMGMVDQSTQSAITSTVFGFT